MLIVAPCAVSLFLAASQLKASCAARPRTPCCPRARVLTQACARPPAELPDVRLLELLEQAYGWVQWAEAESTRRAALQAEAARGAAQLAQPPWVPRRAALAPAAPRSRRARARRAVLTPAAPCSRPPRRATPRPPRRARARRALACSCRDHDPARPYRRSSRLYVTGKAVPTTPEVHAWALLVLLGPGDGRSGLPRVREWVSVVLQQREQHEQVLAAPPSPPPTSPPHQPSSPAHPTPPSPASALACCARSADSFGDFPQTRSGAHVTRSVL